MVIMQLVMLTLIMLEILIKEDLRRDMSSLYQVVQLVGK